MNPLITAILSIVGNLVSIWNRVAGAKNNPEEKAQQVQVKDEAQVDKDNILTQQAVKGDPTALQKLREEAAE